MPFLSSNLICIHQVTTCVPWVQVNGTVQGEESSGISDPNPRAPQTAMLLLLVPNHLGLPQSLHIPRLVCPTVNRPHYKHRTTPWWQPSRVQSNPWGHSSCLEQPPWCLLTKTSSPTTLVSSSPQACNPSRWSQFRIFTICSPWLQLRPSTRIWLQSWLSFCPTTQL